MYYVLWECGIRKVLNEVKYEKGGWMWKRGKKSQMTAKLYIRRRKGGYINLE